MTLSELVETEAKDEDNDFMNFVSNVRILDARQRKVFIETAEAVLKGMREF